MKITKSQKVYVSILGAAICALVWDQMAGNAPKVRPTAGTAIIASVIPTQPTSDDRPKPQGGDQMVQTIAFRLQRLHTVMGDSPNIRDAFSPSPAWVADHGNPRAPDERALAFQRSHRLKLIVIGRNRSQALVDNDFISIGQSIDGFQLRAIGKLAALFVDQDTSVELHISDADVPITNVSAQ